VEYSFSLIWRPCLDDSLEMACRFWFWDSRLWDSEEAARGRSVARVRKSLIFRGSQVLDAARYRN
jgi:hypothetical protein